VFRERSDGKPDNDKKYKISLEVNSVAYYENSNRFQCAVLLGLSFINCANEVLGKLSIYPMIGSFLMIVVGYSQDRNPTSTT
jgi:hypothetical protein